MKRLPAVAARQLFNKEQWLISSAAALPAGLPSNSSSFFFVNNDTSIQVRRFANTPPPRGSFINRLVTTIQKDLEKNKELQEKIKKLKAETEKLEQSEALQQARAKYQLVEKETLKTSEIVRKNLEKLTEQMKQVIEDAKKTEYGRKAAEVGDSLLKSTREAAETLEKSAQALGSTQTYKTVASSMHSVKVEIDDLTLSHVRMYRKPEKLNLRSENISSFQRSVDINTDATSVELHKEAKWYQSFKTWTDNNPAINTPKTEVSEVLTEIMKVDSNFNKDEFLKFCETEIIPNVLEAIIRADLDILKDWCYEILAAGKMMEQGPVLIISFQAHQIEVVKNREGKVVEGDPEKPIRVAHVWVLCRDMEELNPHAAWKLLEMHQAPQSLAL